MDAATKSLSIEDALKKGGIGALSVNVIGLVAGFLLQVFLARILSPDVYGSYQYVISWLSVLVIIAMWGMDGVNFRLVSAYVATREFALLRGLLERSMNLTSLAGLGIAAILSLCGYYFPFLFPPGIGALMVIGALSLPLWALSNVRQVCIASLRFPMKARVPDLVVRPIVIWLCVLALSVSSIALTAKTLLLIHALAFVVTLGLFIFLCERMLPQEVHSAPAQYRMSYWVNMGNSLMGISLVYIIMNQLDILLLGYLRTTADVALYSVSLRVAQFVVFGLQAVNIVAVPSMSALYTEGKMEELQKLVSLAAKYHVFLGIPVFIIILVAGQFVLSIFGDNYQEGWLILWLLGAGQLTSTILGPAAYMLSMSGHQNRVLKLLVVSLLINVCLNIPLVLLYGALGAALATSIALIISNTMMAFNVYSILKIDSTVGAFLSRIFYSRKHSE